MRHIDLVRDALLIITGAEHESMIQALNHTNEDLGHAVALSDQIDFLRGCLAVEVEKTETSSDSTEMLEEDLAGELNAISRFKERIAEAEPLQE